MASSSSQSAKALVPGAELHGFVVRKVTPLKNLRAEALELEHKKTGARVLHVQSNDAENLFCIAFKTPPADDTGLPHILEHSVLAGSKKYPVKDPFVEMLKMSMATFINAMTYSDKTVYPVASNVRQDFFNLVEVYCDATYHPKLTENTFKQEGHHYEFAKKGDTSSDLIIKGIVYNEMKGAYSGAEALLSRHARRCLFTDSIYGNDSGGDPDRIPDLKYEDFKNFHETLYHPSNSLIFIYGDIPTADHLAFLREKLDAFDRRPAPGEIKRQPRWNKPRTEKHTYGIGKEEKADAKSYITLHWLVGDGLDAQDVLAWAILDLVMLGNQGAPLRKAIIDSKLGADLAYAGFSAGRLETTYHIGIKGTEADREGAFVKLVEETLQKIADGGITPEMVDAAFQQISYRYLEIPSMFPLWLMDRAYTTWLYDADPLVYLRADEHIAELRKRYESDRGMFGRMIKERLLSNPHRLLLTMVPDREVQSKKEAEFAKQMAEQKKKFSQEQLTAIAQQADELERLQSTPNSPEALATLPALKVSDLPAKPKHIPTKIEKLGNGAEILRNDVFANGVNYLEIDINLEGLPEELFPYLPLYGDCIRKMGAAGQNYVKLAERIAAHTGGLSFWSGVGSHATDEQRCMRRGRFSLKHLDAKLDDAMAVLRDLMFEVDFSDSARLKDVLTQSKSNHRSNLVQRGMNLAISHAGRGISREAYLSNVMSGLPQMRLIDSLEEGFADRSAGLVEKLNEIRAFLLNRGRITASFTGSDSVYGRLCRKLDDWCGQMRSDAIKDLPSTFKPAASPLREGLAAVADIAYCTHMLPAPHGSHPDATLLGIASRLLSLGYMWEEVRIKGGAYGGGCGFNGGQRSWYFYSYRDPWVNKTLNTFKGVIEHIKKSDWTQAEIDKAIIGTAKEGERPIRPGDATGTALWRYVMGETPELREKKHAQVLAATPREIKRAVLEVLEKNYDKGSTCVFSSREKLENANKEAPERPLTIEDVLK
jgi:presequence protease